jgi:hypothetical protein
MDEYAYLTPTLWNIIAFLLGGMACAIIVVLWLRGGRR